MTVAHPPSFSRAILLGVAVALPLVSLQPPAAIAQSRESAAIANQVLKRLGQMFSPEIQKTLAACQEQGKVNLAAGSDQDGSVICGDGSRTSTVAFNDYVETYSDVLAASSLIGVKSALKANPQIQPSLVFALAKTPNGAATLRNQLRKIVVDSELVAKGSPQSVNFLVDRVVQRTLPVLQNSRSFNNLLGTQAQYSQVVQTFCTPPGSSVTDAKTKLPGLTSVQLYAICIQNSGIAEELLRQSR